MDITLEGDPLDQMQQANVLLHWWLGIVTIQKQQEEKYEKVAVWAVKVVLAWAVKVMNSGKLEGVTILKKAVTSAILNPIQDLAKKSPTTKL